MQAVKLKRIRGLTPSEVDNDVIGRDWKATLNSQFDLRQHPNAVVAFSSGERGCAGSHAHIWKLARNHAGPVCIMEDDIMLRRHFKDLLSTAVKWVTEKSGAPNPILYVEHLVAEWEGDAVVSLTPNYSIRKIRYTWNTGCYVVWPSTIAVLLKNLPMTEPVDVFLARLMYTDKIEAYGVDPAAAYQFCNHCDGNIEHTFAPRRT
jgi:GR25 family glycosyltransferase involved in LPS biosynthesis